ncbi:carbon-nitrogen hydrolase family protein [Virgisporangium aliadipatigenens]|uniref:carbon-nitrogen hydrolase family protein n=1 Tax=Virgisporangium aliadipatigenens TaxID=741659 RepID=UPI001EF1EA3E|nr:carbon-nitrogen hydrolase family protein [Virgisporangium aliadipatigenens]
MSEIVRITACQLDVRDAHRAAALAALAEHVAATRPDVVVLPEMPFSAWLAADPEVDPARWSDSVAAHEAAIKALVELGAPAVVASRPTTGRRNEAFTWSREHGAVGLREKYYLPDEPGYWEATWYDRGERRFDLARVGPARAGVLLCSELWFLEWARHYARAGAELLCVPRATPHETLPKWLAAGQVGAICSGAYCVSSNQWVPDGSPVEAGGLGYVIGPDGEILATTSAAEPFVTVEVDLDRARAAKRTYPRYVRE